MTKIKIKLLQEDAKLPTRAHKTDLGFDLYANEDILIPINSNKKIKTGIAMQFPEGFGGIVKDRSSYAAKGLYTHAGVIDGGYTGEIMVIMSFNPSQDLVDTFYGDINEPEEKRFELFKNKYPDVEVLENYGDKMIVGYKIKKGDKIAQIIPQKIYSFDIETVNELENRDRNNNGFGSSGN